MKTAWHEAGAGIVRGRIWAARMAGTVHTEKQLGERGIERGEETRLQIWVLNESGGTVCGWGECRWLVCKEARNRSTRAECLRGIGGRD